MKKGKKALIISLIVVILLGVGIFCYFKFFNNSDAEAVFCMPVKEVMSGDFGSVNRYSGVVAVQETKKYQVDSSKILKETFVEVGDEVKKGDKLFSYDSDAIKLDIEQIDIDIQKLNADIENNKARIAQLEKDKQTAGEDQKLEYELNIQQIQNDNLSASYSIKTKQNELAKKKESLANAVVVSDVDGVVKSINKPGEGDAYITVMQQSAYVIKATINEMNIYQMSEGTMVNVYSRVNDMMWSGTVSSIDTNGDNSNSNGNFYYEDSSASSSTKYSFYVTLDNDEGLFLGQHVIVKPAVDSNKKGLWLASYFISDIDNNPCVYLGTSGKIKKESVKLGQYDSQTDEYEILSGIDVNDYIAFPDETIKEGSPVAIE